MHVILFRKDANTEREFDVACGFLHTVEYRTDVPHDSVVIPRYSYLPYNRELDAELWNSKGSIVINSLEQHDFIADITQWACGPLQKFTPATWDNWLNLPANTSFIVKGQTNSRKTLFSTHMFCATRDDVPIVASRLLDDMLISQQKIVVREYVPLKQLGTGINGLPISNEHRTFWLAQRGKAHLLSKGFYWATHPELADQAHLSDAGLSVAQEAADIIAQNDYATFFVLDVAETAAGDWLIIEVNDGSMSGLSMCDPHELYGNLRQHV